MQLTHDRGRNWLLFIGCLFAFVFFNDGAFAQTPIGPNTWGGTNTDPGSAAPSTYTPLPATTTPGSTAVSVSQWNRGSGITYNAGSNRYNSKNWYSAGISTVAAAFTAGKYVYFTVTNNSTTELQITNISITGGQASGTGPNTFGMMYQIGSGTATVFTASVAGPTPSFSGLVNLCAGQTATFYVCGWGGTAAAGTWSIGGSSGTGSTAPASITANYANAIAISASSSSSPVVEGGTLLLTGGTVTPGVAPYTYSWTGPLAYSSTAQNPTVPGVATSASGTYSYSATDAFGCSVSNSTSVTVTAAVSCSGTPLPGTASATPASFCNSGSSTLGVTGGTVATGITYQWFSANSPTGTFTAIPGATLNSYTTPTITSNTYYFLQTTCTGSSATVESDTVEVVINPIPTGIATPTGITTLDIGATLPLTDPTTGFTTGWISGSTSVASVDASGNVTGLSAGTTDITYCVTNTFGCTGYSTPLTITVNPYPYCVPPVTSSGDGVGFNTSGGIADITSYTQTGTFFSRVATVGITTKPGATISYTVSNPSTYASTTYYSSIWADWNHSYVFGDSTSEQMLSAQTVTYSGGTYNGSFTVPTTARGGFTVMRVSMGESAATDYTDPCGGGYGSVVDFYVKILPDITLGATPVACLGATAVETINAVTGSASAYYINWDATALTAGFSNILTTPLGSDISISIPSTLTGFSAPTTYNGTLYVTNGAYVSTGTPISVLVNPFTTVAPLTGDSVVCVSLTGTMNDITPAGAWASTNPLVATVDASGHFSGVAAGVTSISYSVTGCGTATTTKNITVNMLPDPGSISGNNEVCLSVHDTLSETMTGGAWSSSASSVATIDGTGIVTCVGAGVTTISYTVTGFCGNSYATRTLTINDVPEAGTITGDSVFCPAGSTTLSESASAGAWSTSNTDAASVSVAGVLSANSPGIDTVLYTITNMCGYSVASFPITVNSLPLLAVLDGLSSLCISDTTTISASVSGGTWLSGSTGLASITAGGFVTAVAAGSVDISYTIANTCGSVTALYTLTINPIADPGIISGPSSVCVGSAILLSESGTGGNWSAANGNTSVSATGAVIGVNTGVDTLYYSVTNICGTTFAQHSVTINPLPQISQIAGDSFICQGSLSSLSDTVTGGTWSASPATIISVDINGNATGLAAGTGTVTYQTSNSCGFLVAHKQITVNPLPDAGVISGTSVLCPGSISTLGETTTGGVWTSSDTAIAKIYTSGVMTGIGPGICVISYTQTNSCGSASATFTITVNTAPGPGSITGASEFCPGNVATLSESTSGGDWSSANTAVMSVDGTGTVHANSAGVSIIYYTISNSCGSVYAEHSITVDPLPDAGSISGSSSVCTGLTDSLSVSASGGVWNSANSGIATVDAEGAVSGISTGNTIISYTVANVCGSATSTLTISINMAPELNPVTGDSMVCQGRFLSLNETTTGVTWNTSDPAIVLVSASGVVTGISTGTATITVSVANSCGSVSAIRNITVNPLPGAISGPSTLCVGTGLTLSDTTAGGSWSSSDPGMMTVDPTTGFVNDLGLGTAIISYTLPSTGCFVTRTESVNPLPNSGIITGPTTLCTGNIITLDDSAPGGTWMASNSHASVSSLGAVTGNSAGVDTIKYTLSNGCGAATARYTITVNPFPTTDTISGMSAVCQGSTITLSVSDTTGTWNLSNNSGALTGNMFTGILAGTDTVFYNHTNSCGSTTAVLVIAVNALPGAITGPGFVCRGAGSILSCGEPGVWNSSDTDMVLIDPLAGAIAGIQTGTATISFTNTNGCTTAISFTVNPAPSVIGGTSSFCVGETVYYSDSATGTWTSSGGIVAIDTSGNAYATAPGADTIVYSNSFGCFVTKTVTANPLPGAIAGPAAVCTGNNISLSDPALGGTWTVSNGTATIDSVTGLLAGVNAGSDTVQYMLPTGCNVLLPINVLAMPLPISGLSATCPGQNDTLSSSGSGIWLASNNNGSVDSATGIFHAVTAGTDTITYTLNGICTVTTVVTINPSPYAGPVVGPDSLCTGTSVTLSDTTSGGTWSATNSNVSVSGAVATGAQPGLDTIYYAVNNVCGTAVASKTITVLQLPAIDAITGTSSGCAGQTVTLADAASGGSWSISGTGPATISTDGIVSLHGYGNDTAVYTITGFCGTRDTTFVIHADTLAIAGITGGSYLCIGHPDTLSGQPTGGTWSASNGFLSVTGGITTGISPGIDTITYSYTGTCGTSQFSIPVPVLTAAQCDSVNLVQQPGTQSFALNIYPNPAAGQVHIMLAAPIATRAQILVWNAMGEKVWEQELTSNMDELLGVQLNSGMYLVVARTGNESFTHRLIIVR